MIEISHKQARYLIREVEDRRLPEEQWAALQAHLEGCPECRDYQARTIVLGRGLHRLLQQRWSIVDGPSPGMPGQVLAQRAARRMRLRRVTYALLGLLFFIGAVALQWRAQVLSPAPAAVSTQPAVLPSFTPTKVNRFQGLVAFESKQAGSGEIFLLQNTGSSRPEMINLTSSHSQDSEPAWSPDGDWLAFLSDRSGKRELYAVSVAGTRLTQLTADPDLDWQGPLSWSADGKWIALTGRRLSQNGERWGYLVPLSGSRPVSLPGTRNIEGKLVFSSTQPLLATPGSIFNIDDGWHFDGWYGLATNESNFVPGPRQKAAPDVAFDWALGAGSLAYLASGQQTGGKGAVFDQIRLSPVIGLNNRDSFAEQFSQIVDRVVGLPSFRSLSYMPGGPFLATLQNANNTGCWTIHLVSAFHYSLLKPINFTGLCVEGQLERASWSDAGRLNAGRWLVVAGRQPNPATGKPGGKLGIYAVQYSPWAAGNDAQPDLERLADLPEGSVTVPRVRPSGESLHIQPRAAYPPENARVQALPSLALTGSLLMTEQDPDPTQGSTISRQGADSSSVVLVPDGAYNGCPAWSPDGQKIAYTSYQSGRGGNGIYIMDADGSNQRLAVPLTQGSIGRESTAYGCPVWSPDGKVMASVRYEGDYTRLAVIGREEGLLGIFPIDSPSSLARPVWSPDGKTIYLAEKSARTSSAYLVSISWSTLTGPLTARVLSGWDDVQAMAISPDGRQMALIAVQNAAENRAARANLFLVDLNPADAGMRITLPDIGRSEINMVGRIFWLPDGGLLFAQPAGPLAHEKAAFVTFDIHEGSFSKLAASEDTLVDWVYKDGWLFYSSESGVWAQEINRERLSPPVQLSSATVSSLDIK